MRTLLVPLALAATLHVGCVEPGGVDCTSIAIPSVSVAVVDEAGVAVPDADVTYTGGSFVDAPCNEGPDGTWSCGFEVPGEIMIRAVADGFAPVEQEVFVDSDECHVITETVTVTLTPASEGAPFPEARVYAFALFDTPEECDELVAQGVNCYQTVDFCPSGEATIVVTDILNRGTYSVSGATITASWETGDVPSDMGFTLDEDTDTLVDDLAANVWERQSGPEWQPNCQ